jgi:hypothetical protein
MMLSTVGTSLLTNALPPDQRGRVIKLANATDADIADGDRTFLDEAAALAQSQLAVADRAASKRLSAEINGILTYEDEAESTGSLSSATKKYLLLVSAISSRLSW